MYHHGKGGIDITMKEVDECFVFSLMTIYNEHRNMEKYMYLLYIEF